MTPTPRPPEPADPVAMVALRVLIWTTAAALGVVLAHLVAIIVRLG